MPTALRNEADWAYFQAGLDRADLVALGRVSHEATPNPKRRRRLILSRGVTTLEQRLDGWWWNPVALPWADVASRLLPQDGCVAVPGGQAAFEAFLPCFTAFHLSRAHNVRLPRGRGLFEACERGVAAESVLVKVGLQATPPRWIDEAAQVSLQIFEAKRGHRTVRA